MALCVSICRIVPFISATHLFDHLACNGVERARMLLPCRPCQRQVDILQGSEHRTAELHAAFDATAGRALRFVADNPLSRGLQFQKQSGLVLNHTVQMYVLLTLAKSACAGLLSATAYQRLRISAFGLLLKPYAVFMAWIWLAGSGSSESIFSRNTAVCDGMSVIREHNKQ